MKRGSCECVEQFAGLRRTLSAGVCGPGVSGAGGVCANAHVSPGTAGGTVRRRAVTVAMATSWGVYLWEQEWPAVTMLGFRRVPSRYTWWSDRALYTAAKTFSVTYWQRFRSWSPSGRISGSTMGTMPCWGGQIHDYITQAQLQPASFGPRLTGYRLQGRS